MDTDFILYNIAYFMVYSFAGWGLESVSKTISQKKFVNSGFLNGPFCPIYGFGAMIMIVCLQSLKGRPILLFIVAFFILSAWEYIVGIFLEKIFKTKYWDYSHLKFNLQGRICLKNSLYWGILGVVFIGFLHPFIQSYIEMIPTDLLLYIVIVIGISMLVDLVISSIAVTNFNSAITKLNELGENIKEKVEELKKIQKKAKLKSEQLEKTTVENMESVIKELKRTQAKLKIRIYRHANRLKRAFPSMKSETITVFLNQKIDLQKLKKNSKRKNEE